MSAGPEAPRGSGSRTVPSPPRGPRPLPVLGDTPPLGSWEPWERRARGGVPGSRGAVRASAGSGSVGERRGEGGGGAGGVARPPRGARPGSAGCRPEGAGRAGLSPGSGGRKGSHPSRPPGRPPPGPPAGPAPRARRAGGGPGPRSCSRVARAPGPGLSPVPRLGLPASPGAAADILRRAGGGERNGIASAAGKWWPGRGRLAYCPGLCLRRASLRAPRPGARSGGPGQFLQAPFFLP